MNFKKLLSLIGMLTVVIPTSLTAVACNSQTNHDVINENKVQKLLENGINGSKLGVTNTQADALKLMQNTDGVKGIATLSFVNKTDSIKLLDIGSNILNINITVGSTTVTTNKALITNISPTNKERLTAIKTELENGIDGSSLSVGNVQQDALDFISSQVINIDPAITFTFVNNDVNYNHLVAGDNKLNIIISIGEDSVTTNKALITNVSAVNPYDIEKAQAVQKVLEGGVDGSIDDLTVKNTQADALKLMQTADIVEINKAVLSFVNPSDAKIKLTDGDNKLNIIINVNTATTTTNQAVITNVNPVNPDDLAKANAVKKIVEAGIDAETLVNWEPPTSAYSYQGLDLMQKADGIKGIATLSFVNQSDSLHLLNFFGDSYLNIKITVGTAEIETNKAKINKLNAVDATMLAMIKKSIEVATDGSSLNTKNTWQDALNLVTKIYGLNLVNITLTIDEDSNPTTKLTAGNNNIKHVIISNTGSPAGDYANLLITNVKNS